MGNKSAHKLLVLLVAAALLLAASFACALQGEGRAQAQGTFNDIGSQPAEIQEAIGYAAAAGYMQGYPDGGFHPAEATSRIDCARALVTISDHEGEAADPSITFTDLPASDPNFIWANLAVKYGLLDRLADGSFAPGQGVLFERVAMGAAAAMGMGDAAQNVNSLISGTPYYGGAMAVFMDLRLKYRYSKVWPGWTYPRGEMALTLYRMDHVDSWRPWYVRDSYSAARCVLPPATPGQAQAMSFAFERLGCPYLYGGERDSEGGFDCSGFVYNTLCIRMGYPMMRVADDQARDDRYLFVPRGALQPGDAIFFYDEANGNPTDYIGHAGMYVGNGLFIHSGSSNGGISIDCLDNNDYYGTHFAWGRRVVGGPYNDRFDTYLLLYNPSGQELPVDVRYLRPQAAPQIQTYALAPHSRFTVPVDNLFPADEVSMEVSAPSPGVVAERAMYFDYEGWADGGHAAVGMAQATLHGFFAEGYTGDGFDTWLLLANPEDRVAQVEVTYLLEGGAPVVKTYDLAPASRFTVLVNGVAGIAPGNVGMSFRSLNGVKVAAERAMYFNYAGKRDGHCSQAITETSQQLYLAEGYTGSGFDTWLLLANPNTAAAEVQISYLVQGGQNVTETRTVPAQSRLTVYAEDKVVDSSFGTTITSLNGVGVVAERAMYFDYGGGMRGGHCSAAVKQPRNSLCLAEGYTGGYFDTWVLVANPNGGDATARLTFAREDGVEVTRDVTIPALSRFSLCVNQVPGLEECAFSTRVDANLPVFVERSMYFYYEDYSGGTNCPALQGPSEHRFFAEGYTGG
ncbi:MAG: C40 family peptidase [Actinomycetota bacterium]